jgi:hypothetical protein
MPVVTAIDALGARERAVDSRGGWQSEDDGLHDHARGVE